jgi:L-seryl-tRNA(Ser) seleniumtransferase
LWEPPADLIDKARLAAMPRHGIGRALKVSKEQIAALLTALKLFATGEYERELVEMSRQCKEVAKGLQTMKPCPVYIHQIPSNGESFPLLELTLDPSKVKRSAFEICRALRRGKPGVHVGHLKLAQGTLIINPLHLNDERTAALIRRLHEELSVP